MSIFDYFQQVADREAMNSTMQRIRAEQRRLERNEYWAKVLVLGMAAVAVIVQVVTG